jgi:hypothetical protein
MLTNMKFYAERIWMALSREVIRRPEFVDVERIQSLADSASALDGGRHDHRLENLKL